MKKILIVDNDTAFLDNIKEHLSKNEYFSDIKLAQNGWEALDIAKEFKPDVVLTAVVMSDGDGIWLIEHLKSEEFDNKNRVIMAILDSKISAIENLMWSLGADYLVVKPFDISGIATQIKLVCESKEASNELSESSSSQMQSSSCSGKNICKSTEDPQLEQRVTNIFHKLGMPAHIKGYEYLRFAILRVLENKSLLHSVTKELYPMTAKAFGSKPSRVERAIRHAIEVAWTRGDPENIAEFFGCTVLSSRGKPTNSEFLAMISDKILLDLSA